MLDGGRFENRHEIQAKELAPLKALIERFLHFLFGHGSFLSFLWGFRPPFPIERKGKSTADPDRVTRLVWVSVSVWNVFDRRTFHRRTVNTFERTH
jgi:hypothetical protein